MAVQAVIPTNRSTVALRRWMCCNAAWLAAHRRPRHGTPLSDYLQLYFADAATEYLRQPTCAGVRGGARARTKGDHRAFAPVLGDHVYGVGHMAWQLGWFTNGTDDTGDAGCDVAYTNDTSLNVLQNPWYLESTSCFRPIPQVRAIAERGPAPFLQSSRFRRGRDNTNRLM